MSLRARMTRLEKATRTMAPNECACHGAPGVSGPRLIYSYERPELQTPEALEVAERDTDHVERCAYCGRVRPIVEILWVENWRERGGGLMA
jgi:hypothetical protein